MEPVEFSSEMYCDVAQASASDVMVANAARVSTLGEMASAADHDRDAGLINFLMKNRHMSPFEHGMFTWRVKVPIFVLRELHRHRIASYNEWSARYSEMKGLFYVPDDNRPLTQVGKPGAYRFEPGDSEQVYATQQVIKECSESAWHCYQVLISEAGIAKEVARMVLPVNIYSVCYVTFNPRSLMNLLSLRVKSSDSAYPSFPMQEINELANLMEISFAKKMPLTHEAFVKNGRIGS